jgi:hypothetical protein
MQQYLQWQYLLFELPFVAGLIYLFMMMVGLGTDGTDLDHDLDFDHDMHIHIEVGDVSDGNVFLEALSLLGVGKVPISIVIMCFCFSWGFFGWATNELLSPILPVMVYVWASLAAAFFGSVITTKFLAQLIAKFMPGTETFCSSESDLVGKRAKAKYPITDHSGSATLIDEHGHFQEVICRVDSASEHIPANTMVVLVRYECDEHAFYVRRDTLGQVTDLTINPSQN